MEIYWFFQYNKEEWLHDFSESHVLIELFLHYLKWRKQICRSLEQLKCSKSVWRTLCNRRFQRQQHGNYSGNHGSSQRGELTSYSSGFRRCTQLCRPGIYCRTCKIALQDYPEIPTALHLDHGSSYEICKACIDGGFSSVMYDGSKHPYEENVRITKQIVGYAHDKGVVVEAELGRLAGVEDLVSVDAKMQSSLILIRQQNLLNWLAAIPLLSPSAQAMAPINTKATPIWIMTAWKRLENFCRIIRSFFMVLPPLFRNLLNSAMPMAEKYSVPRVFLKICWEKLRLWLYAKLISTQTFVLRWQVPSEKLLLKTRPTLTARILETSTRSCQTDGHA